MNKKFKRLSALFLAVVMLFSMSAMASAATMKVYIREWNTTNNNHTKVFPFGETPVATITGVQPGDTYKKALMRGTTQIKTTWDEDYPQYLEAVELPGRSYSKANNGANYDIKTDEKGNVVAATWKGDSWMWYGGVDAEINAEAYPDTTLGETTVPSADEFSLILSYDHSEFSWG